MSSYKFRYPNGDTISSTEEFLKFYGQVYYFIVREHESERHIENILKAGIRNRDDIETVMCWKTGGKIKNGAVVTRYQSIDIDSLCEKLLSRTFSIFNDQSAEALVNELITLDGMGFVYAVTLLHFMSKGQYPIYDRFAHFALKAICAEEAAFRTFKDGELMKEIHQGHKKKHFDEYKTHYIGRINDIFHTNYGEKPSADRQVDRALWAYGHLFRKPDGSK